MASLDEQKKPKNIFFNLSWCLRYIYHCSPLLFVGIILFQILAAVVPFVRNRAFSWLLDSLIPGNITHGNWSFYLEVFIGLLFLASIISFFQNQFSRIFDTKLQAFLRINFINKVSQLDYQHLEGKETGNLISKVDEEFGWRIRQVFTDVSGVFSNLISLITVTIILLPKFPLLWLLIFVGQIPEYLVERYWVQKDWQLHESNSERNKLMWDLNDQLRQKNYISELRINNAVDYLFKKYVDIYNFFTRSRVELRINQTPSEIGIMLFSSLVNAISFYILIVNTKNGLITVGLFTFYFQSIMQTVDVFRGLVYSSVSLTENSYHISNLRQVMNLKNIILGGDKTISPPIPPKIEFVDVSFKYPNSKRYVYRHLNLTIDSSEEVAIVGANGAGKSTLIKLICHFYEPTSGKILVNGIDLRDVKMDNWYKQLSYLSQEFNHFGNLNLRDNVLLGNPEVSDDDQILDALHLADAEFTKKYSKKLDTMLSQRYGGEEPSWGQWQKIAIARVFYRNSPVIILDEPTASIDAVSESKIFDRLYQTVKNKSLIIVSHRFSTVRNAQRIIVVDKGKIVEQGSHSELLAKDGTYAHSFKLQARGYQSEDLPHEISSNT